jgi:DNA-binding IclR family transcriptional regulator
MNDRQSMLDSPQPDRDTERLGAPRVAALERGLKILDAFRSGKGTLSLGELAEITGLYKSTILRLCASLQHLGFLQRLENGRFRLGPAVFQLGRVYQSSFRLADLVRPVLAGLAAKTGETASLYVRDGEWEVCLFRVDSPRPVRDAGIAEGDRFAIDNSACSRVISAFSGEPGREYDEARREFAVFARQTKRAPGTVAMASPVFGLEQKLVGALLVSGPELRFTVESIAATRSALIKHAADLTRALGGDASVFPAAEGV